MSSFIDKLREPVQEGSLLELLQSELILEMEIFRNGRYYYPNVMKFIRVQTEIVVVVSRASLSLPLTKESFTSKIGIC